MSAILAEQRPGLMSSNISAHCKPPMSLRRELPPNDSVIRTFAQRNRPIFEGKFTDRHPVIPGAGYVIGLDAASVPECLEYPQPPLDDLVRKFHNYTNPDHSVATVHYGQANDPERVTMKQMTHGMTSRENDGAHKVLNPPLQTAWQHQLQLVKENIYKSNKTKPLARTHTPDLAPNVDPGMTMGRPNPPAEGAWGCIRPEKTAPQLRWEDEQCRDLYRKSHLSYQSGEQKRRDYPWESFDINKKWGGPTPHDNEGKLMKRTMHWRADFCDDKRTATASASMESWKLRNTPILGKGLDPNAETRSNLAPDHVFGIGSSGDKITAGALMHHELPIPLSGGYNRRRNVIRSVRHRLSGENWRRFEALWLGFTTVDSGATGRLPKEAVREILDRFNVPLDAELIEQMLDLCDVNEYDAVEYAELLQLIDWTDRSVQLDGLCDKSNETPEKMAEIDAAIKSSRKNYRTTYHDYGSTAQLHKNNLPVFGTPSVRSDLEAPRYRKTADKTNYGDEPGAGALLSPNVFAANGVYERDVFQPRGQQEMKEVLCNVGVDMSEEMFQRIWAEAATIHSGGVVTFESFRSVLDQLQGSAVQARAK